MLRARENELDQIWYTIDADNRISAVSENWDANAKKHKSIGATSAVILGKPFFEFIEGFGSRSTMNAVLFVCRKRHRCFVHRYECQSGSERYSTVMCAVPEFDGGVTVYHETEKAEPLDERSLATRYGRGSVSPYCMGFAKGDECSKEVCHEDRFCGFDQQTFDICRNCRLLVAQKLRRMDALSGPVLVQSPEVRMAEAMRHDYASAPPWGIGATHLQFIGRD